MAPYPGAEASVATWAKYDGCATSSVVDEHVDVDAQASVNGSPAKSTVTRWTGCRPGGAAELWTIPGGGHGPDISDAFPGAVLDFFAGPPETISTLAISGSSWASGAARRETWKPPEIPQVESAIAGLSTTSPSRTAWSRPTRWPSKRAEGPQTRAPVKRRGEVVVDPVSDGLDRRAGVERERLRVRLAHRSEVDPDQAGQAPRGIAEGLEAASSRTDTGTTSRSGNASRMRAMAPLPRLVGAGRREEGRLVDAREGDLGHDRPEFVGIGVGPGAVDDRVGGAQDAEQRPPPTPVVVGARDEPGISTSWTRTPRSG